MSEALNGKPQPNGQPEPNATEYPCMVCPGKIIVPDTQLQVLEGGNRSVLIADHGNAIVCHQCGAVYAKVINQKETVIITSTRIIAKPDRKIQPASMADIGRIG